MIDFSAYNFDWGLFEAPATSTSFSAQSAEVDVEYRTPDFSFSIGRFSRSLNGEAQKISDNDVYKAACSLTRSCRDSSEAFYLLSCINLLEAALKTPEWKEKINFIDLKVRSVDLFSQCIREKRAFKDVRLYYDRDSQRAFFKVYGVLFCFNNIRSNSIIEEFCADPWNQALHFDGTNSMKIAPKILEIAENHCNLQCSVSNQRLEFMREKFQAEGKPKLYNRFRPKPDFSYGRATA